MRAQDHKDILWLLDTHRIDHSTRDYIIADLVKRVIELEDKISRDDSIWRTPTEQELRNRYCPPMNGPLERPTHMIDNSTEDISVIPIEYCHEINVDTEERCDLMKGHYGPHQTAKYIVKNPRLPGHGPMCQCQTCIPDFYYTRNNKP